jgi:hypothetical protein
MGNSITEEILKILIMKSKKLISTTLASMLIVVLCFTTSNVAAQTKATKAKMDCCMMKDGKMMCMMHDGKMTPMKNDMTMKDGSKCMTNGECMMKDGKKMTMTEGQCMDMNGKMSMHSKAHKMMKTKKAMAAYTCPMHHEVTSDKQGKCPKCGMDLVMKK